MKSNPYAGTLLAAACLLALLGVILMGVGAAAGASSYGSQSGAGQIIAGSSILGLAVFSFLLWLLAGAITWRPTAPTPRRVAVEEWDEAQHS